MSESMRADAMHAQRKERPTSLFETMGVFGGELRLWDRHVARISASMCAHGDEEPIDAELLAQAKTPIMDMLTPVQSFKDLCHDILLGDGAVGLGLNDGFGAGRRLIRQRNRWSDLCLIVSCTNIMTV